MYLDLAILTIMKLFFIRILVSVLLTIFSLSSFAQLKMRQDTIFCEVNPNERGEFRAYLENFGVDTIQYKYELVAENMTQLTTWDVIFCDYAECLIGFMDSASYRIAGNSNHIFQLFIGFITKDNASTETYVTYKVTAQSDSTNVSMFTFITRKPLTILEEGIQILGQTNIYPNPTEGIVTLSYKGMPNEPYNVSVINVLGEMVYSNVLEVNATNLNNEILLDLRDLQKGAYFLTHSNGQEIKTERLTIK